jgi:hypothetical protein
MYELSHFSYMFRRLLRRLQGELPCVLKPIVTEGGAKSAETCRRQVIINMCIVLVYLGHDLCKMHGMENFNTFIQNQRI